MPGCRGCRCLTQNGQPKRDKNGKAVTIAATTWLDQNRPVEQMTWCPGEPMLIRDRLVVDGGWIDRKDVTCFNLYRPPRIELGDASKAGPWIEHAHKVYPDDAGHIIQWLAQRVQRPQDKINHALVLGGAQGIGKDTMLEPVKYAIGPWNFHEVSPTQMLGRFNSFAKSVILRVSEARDLGEIDRFKFYDHTKIYTAAPPDVLRVDEKHLREHYVFNCLGFVITTNHKTDGIYLPADDRRHYVAWSNLTKDDFATDYWTTLWSWYQNGGFGHVAAYLASSISRVLMRRRRHRKRRRSGTSSMPARRRKTPSLPTCSMRWAAPTYDPVAADCESIRRDRRMAYGPQESTHSPTPA